ncbi:MAG: STAS domain-containing protein [Pseudomonadota bacterium]
MSGKILVGQLDGVYVIRFEGDVRLTIYASLDRYIHRMLDDPGFSSVLIDLNAADAIDSTSLGVLAKLSLAVQERCARLPTLICGNPDIVRVLHNMGFDDVFVMVDDNFESGQNLAELTLATDFSEAQMRDRVIEAHRTLMEMNEGNENTFRDLVKALESEGALVRRHAI